MPSRIQDIIIRARDTLGDASAQRWTNDRLLRLVSEAQRDIASHSRILKGFTTLNLAVGVHTYTLPEDVWLITRATFGEAKIPLYSHDDLDRIVSISRDRAETFNARYTSSETIDDNYYKFKWQTDTGDEIEALIYDRREINKIRVYPIPNEDIADNIYTFANAGYLADIIYEANTPYGVWTEAENLDAFVDNFGVTTSASAVNYIITDSSSCNGIELETDVTFSSPFGLVGEYTETIKSVQFHGDEALGVTTSVDDYNIGSVYGIVTEVCDSTIDRTTFSSVFGVVTNIAEAQGVVDIWYIRIPNEVTSDIEDLEIPAMFDKAIKHYVVANAFDDDLDTRYAEKSAKAFELYQRDLQLAIDTDRTDATRASQYTDSYRGFV